ncbi:hypothetical protein EON82_05485 [bacterium]|nr:MAG: hypothetical protein EON82_05485 [bacterium]
MNRTAVVSAGLAALVAAGAFAWTHRAPTLKERETRRREMLRTESVESRMRRLGEEGGYNAAVNTFKREKFEFVDVEELEGESNEVALPPGTASVAFLLEDAAGESARLEADGLPSVELKPEEGTRSGTAELPEGWEGRRRVTLRGAGYARLAFVVPPVEWRARRLRPSDAKSLDEALSRAVRPLSAKGFVPFAEFSGDQKSDPYLDLFAPGGDLVLVWALDPRSNEPGGVTIDVTRHGYDVERILGNEGQGWSGTTPLSLQPGKYVLGISVGGKWLIRVYRKG